VQISKEEDKQVKLTILGTAAAEGWPATFCTCEACRVARKLGGHNIRRRASYQLGDTIHIDWGPDSYNSMISFGLDYSELAHLLVTHAHWDHWVPNELRWRCPGFSRLAPTAHLNIYGNEMVQDLMSIELEGEPADCAMSFELIEPFEVLNLGDDVMVTPLPAAHAPDQEAFIFHLDVDGTEVLIGHDSGWFFDEVFDHLASAQLKLVLLDCTYGTNDRREGHMGGMAVVETAERLRMLGAAAPDCRIIATHFSHNCLKTHDELAEFFAPHGIEVAYDGMEIEL
jgi:phosphoribosyl 1,2-cyclic phosphate phosphodiesterase